MQAHLTLLLLELVLFRCLGTSCAFAFLPSLSQPSSLTFRRQGGWSKSRITNKSSSTRRYANSHVDPRLVARSVRPSVVLVVPVGVRNSTARGSGFVVDYPPTNNVNNGDAGKRDAIYLLTAAHVAAPGHRIEVTFPPTETLRTLPNSNPAGSVAASVVGRNPSSDLALLKVELPKDDIDLFSRNHPPLQLGLNEVAVGTPTFAIGFPSGGVVGSAITAGVVCASALGLSSPFPRIINGFNGNNTDVNGENVEVNGQEETRFVVTDAAMAGGMSGGPLVDDSSVVVGMNALINMELRALGNYAIDASECRAFLSDLADRLDGMIDNSEHEHAETPDSEKIAFGVMLYNDRFNKRERVSKILNEIAELDAKEAEKVMMEAHRSGSSVIREFPNDSKDEAKKLCDALRGKDILVEVQQVSKETQL